MTEEQDRTKDERDSAAVVADKTNQGGPAFNGSTQWAEAPPLMFGADVVRICPADRPDEHPSSGDRDPASALARETATIERAREMNLNEIKPSQVLVSIPLVHAGIATLFLFSYCLGFGSHITSFISPTDIFRISISDLLRTYLFSLAWPALIVVNTLTHVHSKVTPKPPRPRIASRKLVLLSEILEPERLLRTLAVTIAPAGAYRLVLDAHRAAQTSSFYIVIPLMLIGFLWAWRVQRRLQLSYAMTEALRFGLMATLFSISGGLDAGQADRFLAYNSSNYGSHTYCGNVLVLRRLSDLYLGVMPNSQKVLIDGDCKTKFTVPKPTPITVMTPFSYLPGLH